MQSFVLVKSQAKFVRSIPGLFAVEFTLKEDIAPPHCVGGGNENEDVLPLDSSIII